MSSEAITRNDLTAILNEVLPPTPSEYKKLLWSNPSPTSSFAAQTIISNTDLSEYDVVEIEIFERGSSQTTGCITSSREIKVPSSGSITGTIQVPATNVFSYRNFTITPTSIACDTAYWRPTYNNSGENAITTLVIPANIYGIKYERVAPPQLEDLTIIEDLGVYNIPSTGTWTFPNVKPYKRMFICFPIWGAYNSSTLASTPIFADANQSSTTITNWTNRAGGVVTNTTVSAYVLAIRMEF